MLLMQRNKAFGRGERKSAGDTVRPSRFSSQDIRMVMFEDINRGVTGNNRQVKIPTLEATERRAPVKSKGRFI
jgi:hypothetical protein